MSVSIYYCISDLCSGKSIESKSINWPVVVVTEFSMIFKSQPATFPGKAVVIVSGKWASIPIVG